jgi:hypothetical protein
MSLYRILGINSRELRFETYEHYIIVPDTFQQEVGIFFRIWAKIARYEHFGMDGGHFYRS